MNFNLFNNYHSLTPIVVPLEILSDHIFTHCTLKELSITALSCKPLRCAVAFRCRELAIEILSNAKLLEYDATGEIIGNPLKIIDNLTREFFKEKRLSTPKFKEEAKSPIESLDRLIQVLNDNKLMRTLFNEILDKDFNNEKICCLIASQISGPVLENSKGGQRCRPLLSTACINGQSHLIKVLLSRGVNPNGLPNTIYSPMACAIRNKHQNVVDILKNYDADADKKDKLGRSAKDRALRLNLTNMLLNQAGISSLKVETGGAPFCNTSLAVFKTLTSAEPI